MRGQRLRRCDARRTRARAHVRVDAVGCSAPAVGGCTSSRFVGGCGRGLGPICGACSLWGAEHALWLAHLLAPPSWWCRWRARPAVIGDLQTRCTAELYVGLTYASGVYSRRPSISLLEPQWRCVARTTRPSRLLSARASRQRPHCAYVFCSSRVGGWPASRRWDVHASIGFLLLLWPWVELCRARVGFVLLV